MSCAISIFNLVFAAASSLCLAVFDVFLGCPRPCNASHCCHSAKDFLQCTRLCVFASSRQQAIGNNCV